MAIKERKTIMKACTDLKQSEKLAKFLPLESADTVLSEYEDGSWHYEEWVDKPYVSRHSIPCWSLAALLDVLSEKSHSIDEDGAVDLSSYKNIEWNCGLINAADLEASTSSNPVDACVEIILKLHEIKML
jgi:hypothetical protein